MQKRIAASIGFATLVALSVLAGSGQEILGRVTAVADGDSLTITDRDLRSFRVRLQGIDAPEHGQPFSRASKSALGQMLFGRDVVVIPHKVDRYGRIVGTVLVGGRDAGLEQLRSGLAWFYTFYEHELTLSGRNDYLAAQRLAKQQRRGLWSETAPVPPWRFRRK